MKPKTQKCSKCGNKIDSVAYVKGEIVCQMCFNKYRTRNTNGKSTNRAVASFWEKWIKLSEKQ